MSKTGRSDGSTIVIRNFIRTMYEIFRRGQECNNANEEWFCELTTSGFV